MSVFYSPDFTHKYIVTCRYQFKIFPVLQFLSLGQGQLHQQCLKRMKTKKRNQTAQVVSLIFFGGGGGCIPSFLKFDMEC